MDIEQASKTIQWLDDERRKDKQEITALQERVQHLTGENTALHRKLAEMDAAISNTNAMVARLSKIDGILEQNRKEMARQLDEVERRRADAEKEADRLRKIERESINKTLAELRKSVEGLPKLERALSTRQDEEARLTRMIAEIQLKVNEFNKHVDERNRAVTVLDESRRQDTKRIVDLQTEVVDLRKRVEDSRGKYEILEDITRRTDVRLAEVFLAENDRKALQAHWIEAQSVVLTEQDRKLADIKAKVEAELSSIADYARRMDQHTENFRDMRRIVEEARQLVEIVERRVIEAAEVQRLAEERLRQDWASFLADDQKRWTSHMLLRDEQWREHDRIYAKHVERTAEYDDQIAEIAATVRQMQAHDAGRMQTLLNVVRELAAEYDPSYTKVR
jgi:DNA repair exonuclease SbcCD ATPase subunit